MGLESFTSNDKDDTSADDPLDGLDNDELRDRLKTLRQIVVSHDAEIERLADDVDELENKIDNLITLVEYLQEHGGNVNDQPEGMGSDENETDNEDATPLFE